jgi:hypothetical protein
MIQGRLPDRLSRDGAEWTPDAVAESKKGIEGLETLVDGHGTAIGTLSTTMVTSLTELGGRVDSIGAQVETLDGEVAGSLAELGGRVDSISARIEVPEHQVRGKVLSNDGNASRGDRDPQPGC